MPGQVVIPCDSCGVRIALNDNQLQGTSRSPSGVYEFECPRCNASNQLWWATPEARKTEDLPINTDRYFTRSGKAKRLEEIREQAEKDLRSEQAQRQGAEKRTQRQREVDEASRLKLEKTRAKQAQSTSDSEDWYDDEGGGRTSNDDRSDSMNPNNDAYGASRR